MYMVYEIHTEMKVKLRSISVKNFVRVVTNYPVSVLS